MSQTPREDLSAWITMPGDPDCSPIGAAQPSEASEQATPGEQDLLRPGGEKVPDRADEGAFRKSRTVKTRLGGSLALPIEITSQYKDTDGEIRRLGTAKNLRFAALSMSIRGASRGGPSSGEEE